MTGITNGAMALRATLAEVIEEEGPTPCQTSDPELWFDQSSRPSVKYAVRECRTNCPARVQAVCLAYAIEAKERHGVWGGMSMPIRNKNALS